MTNSTPTRADTIARLDEIEAYCDAATPGPWRVPVANLFRVVAPVDDKYDSSTPRICETVVEPIVDDFPDADNARFIANARTDLPALISALREAETECAELREERDEIEQRLSGKCGQHSNLSPYVISIIDQLQDVEARNARLVEALDFIRDEILNADTNMLDNDHINYVLGIVDEVIAKQTTPSAAEGATE